MLSNGWSCAQETNISGRVLDLFSNKTVTGARVFILNSSTAATTSENGTFLLVCDDAMEGEQILLIEAEGYLDKKFRLVIDKGEHINFDPILLEGDLSSIQSDISVISLTDYELDEENDVTANFSGLLDASGDVFLNAAAYDFSPTFFKPRGLDSKNARLLINGVALNKFYDGRPQWGSIGGLNDAQRIREFSRNNTASDFDYGGLTGTNNITMRASAYAKGGKISLAMANRSYEYRIMASYNSGLTAAGWSYSILASRRFGDSGYIEGTPYDANSFFVAIEKKLGPQNSLNISAMYTPVRRGRGTALTSEVERLKGRSYNPHWGFQQGVVRSARERRVEEPMVMLNHFWDVSDSFRLNSNVLYQFGELGNSRLDYGGIRNPAPNYYQRLPSYFLRDPQPTNYDFLLAYEAQQEFIDNGQLNWDSFYLMNTNTTDGLSRIIVQEDVTADKLFVFNNILSARLNQRLNIDGKVEFRKLNSSNYAIVKDVLGGSGFRDIDYFGSDFDQVQNDLDNPERIAKQGERYKYNYMLRVTELHGFVQAQVRLDRMQFYFSARAGNTSYQREGLVRNGYFPEDGRSLGASENLSFFSLGAKTGGTYNINGRHFTEINLAYEVRPPLLRNSFANPRQNNDAIEELTSEKVIFADLSYMYRSSVFDARISGFYADVTDQTDLGFYFTQNALGSEDNNAFVQEVVTGLDTRNVGLEAGLEATLLSVIKIKAVASFGQYLYTNDPELYLSGDDFDLDVSDDFVEGNDLVSLGKRKVHLKNYHVAGGPQRAYQLGLEYRDPNYWWAGASVNYFTNSYVDISFLRRTRDFYTDRDGLPFNDYDEDIARKLLKQERLEDYFLVNLVGGKSWRIKSYNLGLFASVNNLLDTKYRTGGFEDSRRVSYRQRLEEEGRSYGPLFGNRYFFGNGITYYLSIYFRF